MLIVCMKASNFIENYFPVESMFIETTHEGSVLLEEYLESYSKEVLKTAAEEAKKAKDVIIENLSEYLPPDIHMQVDIFDESIENSILNCLDNER